MKRGFPFKLSFVLALTGLFLSGTMAATAGECSRLYQMPVESREYSSVLAGCIMEIEGSAGKKPADRQAGIASLREARKQWDACLLDMVDAFDDRISPASDIATALQDECRAEYERLARISYTSDLSFAKACHDRVRETKKRVTQLVLSMRAQKRKQEYPKW